MNSEQEPSKKFGPLAPQISMLIGLAILAPIAILSAYKNENINSILAFFFAFVNFILFLYILYHYEYIGKKAGIRIPLLGIAFLVGAYFWTNRPPAPPVDPDSKPEEPTTPDPKEKVACSLEEVQQLFTALMKEKTVTPYTSDLNNCLSKGLRTEVIKIIAVDREEPYGNISILLSPNDFSSYIIHQKTSLKNNIDQYGKYKQIYIKESR